MHLDVMCVSVRKPQADRGSQSERCEKSIGESILTNMMMRGGL
jgi:hypothetical protein